MSIPYKVCKISHFEWKHGGHVVYYVNDSCHSPDCHMTMDFSIDSHGILDISFWRKLCWFDAGHTRYIAVRNEQVSMLSTTSSKSGKTTTHDDSSIETVNP